MSARAIPSFNSLSILPEYLCFTPYRGYVLRFMHRGGVRYIVFHSGRGEPCRFQRVFALLAADRSKCKENVGRMPFGLQNHIVLDLGNRRAPNNDLVLLFYFAPSSCERFFTFRIRCNVAEGNECFDAKTILSSERKSIVRYTMYSISLVRSPRLVTLA